MAKAIGRDFFKLDVASEADWPAIADTVTRLEVVMNTVGFTWLGGPVEDGAPAHDRETADPAN